MANHNEKVIRVIVEGNLTIPLDDRWTLSADSFNYILSRKTKATDKARERNIVEGYYSSLEDALNTILDRKLKESDVDSISTLKKVLNKTRKEIKTYCEQINKYVKND